MFIASQESEWLEMSQRDRDRLKVLHGVIQGERRQKEASRLLRLSVRRVRRLVRRLREAGDRGIIHRLRGRPGNRQLPAGLRSGWWRNTSAATRDLDPRWQVRSW